MGYPSHQFTYGLGEIIDRLGQRVGPRGQRKICWQLRYVERLIDGAGFPPPLPLLAGDHLAVAVKPASRWPVAAVEQWFEDRGPTGPAAADRAQRREADREMDDRAEEIGLMVVSGGRS